MLKLKVITPSTVIHDDLVDEVTIPTSMGVITVLNKHIPLIASIKHGALTMRTKESELSYAVSSGVVNVYPHIDEISTVVILLEDVNKLDGEDEEIKERALMRARELAHEKLDEFSFGTFESQIERELSKVKFTKRNR